MILKPAARYPADPRAVFILALSVFSGLTALALDAAPESLHAALPPWAVATWGVLLTIGSATTLIGMKFQNVNGIVIEQIGSVMVAATTIFYAGVAFAEIGLSALQGVGIILAWGLSCGLRWIQLQALINDSVGRANKRLFLERLESEIEARAEHARRERQRERESDPHTDWREHR